MEMTDFVPTELKSVIVRYCSNASLAGLALSNKEFRTLAEKELYNSVTFRTWNYNPGPFQTLAEVTTKAFHVKDLNLECSRGCSGPHEESTIAFLLRAAQFMKNLTSLHLRLRENLKHHIKDFDEVLCGGHFQLNALVAPEPLDLERIVENHPQLDVLGVYVTTQIGPPRLVSTLRKRPPVVVAIGDPHVRWFGVRYTRGPFYYHLILLPDLLRLEDAKGFGVLFHRYFALDEGVAVKLDPEEIERITVHIRDAPPEDVFRAFAGSIASLFKQLRAVTFYVQPSLLKEWRPSHIGGDSVSNIQVIEWDHTTPLDIPEDEFVELEEPTPVFSGSKDELAQWAARFL